MTCVVALTLELITLLLRLNFPNLAQVAMIMVTMPLALVRCYG